MEIECQPQKGTPDGLVPRGSLAGLTSDPICRRAGTAAPARPWRSCDRTDTGLSPGRARGLDYDWRLSSGLGEAYLLGGNDLSSEPALVGCGPVAVAALFQLKSLTADLDV